MRSSRIVFVLLAAATLTVSACGSSTPAKNTTSGAATSNAATSSTSLSKATNPANPSLAPVTIGFHNTNIGAYAFPDTQLGFTAGLKYVNSELGGVNGHELKAVNCSTDGTPESSINCANQFVQKGVAASVQGVDLGEEAAMPVLQKAGILEMTYEPLGAIADHGTGSVITFGPSSEGGEVVTGLAQLARTGSKKVAYVLADQPLTHAVMNLVIAPAAQKVGVAVQSYFFKQPTDWATLAATVVGNGTDSIALFGSDPDYIAGIPAFRSAGFKGTIDASQFSQFGSLSAANLKNVIIQNQTYNEQMVSSGVPARAQADIAAYLKYVPHASVPSRARTGFYMAVMAASVLRQVTDPTSANAVHAQAIKAKGHVFFTDTNYDCANPSWPGTTSCLSGSYFTSITSDHRLQVLPNQPVDLGKIKPASS